MRPAHLTTSAARLGLAATGARRRSHSTTSSSTKTSAGRFGRYFICSTLRMLRAGGVKGK